MLHASFEGAQIGTYRERNRLVPIIARAPRGERADVESINDLQIWSPLAREMMPITQVVSAKFPTSWENPIIQRRNRVSTMTIHADPKVGNASVLFERISPKIVRALEGYKKNHSLGEEYSFRWGGEYESSRDAQKALAGSIPLFILLMVLIVIFLFNAIRQPLIIWLCVPLGLIGVTVGLLVMGQPFGFIALLGMLSLMGMLIKNAIVLIDQIDLEIRQGKGRYDAILDSAVSRTRPVMMAAATTVLDMMPLVFDAFYVSMAVTIMFGLTFAAVLTLLVVPVFYAIIFRISCPEK
jgi:multidrug efflux pump subunit AcrB